MPTCAQPFTERWDIGLTTTTARLVMAVAWTGNSFQHIIALVGHPGYGVQIGTVRTVRYRTRQVHDNDRSSVRPVLSRPKPGYLSGANVMDIAVIGIMAALLENDRSGNATRIADAYGRVHSQTLVQSEDRVDGIKPDGSFQQHGGLIYDGAYLFSSVCDPSAHVILLALKVGCSSNSFIQLSLLALGTQFQAKKEVQQSFGRWFEGARWMTYTNVMNNVVHWDLSVIGRFISYPVADGRASADLRMDLSQILKLGKAWSQRDLIEFGTRLTGSADNSANSGGLVGSRMYIDCRNCDDRQDGAEYEDIFAGLDYSIPPGITTDYAAAKLECATATRAGADSYAGGVEAGDVAMAAMRYLNPLSQSFGFYKAWFFFPKQRPTRPRRQLFSNIPAQPPCFSVLDQRLRSGDVYLNGQPISEGGNFTRPIRSGMVVPRYTFPPDQAISTPVSVCLQSKSGDWSKIGTIREQGSTVPTANDRQLGGGERAAMDSHATVLGAAFWKPLGGSVSVKEMGVWAGGGSRSGGDAQVQGRGAYQGQDLCCGPDTWFWTVTVKVNWLGQAISRRYAKDGCSGSECPGLKRTVGRPVSSAASEISKLGPNMSPEARLVQLNDHLQPRFLISTSMRRIGAYIERKTSTFKTKFKSAAHFRYSRGVSTFAGCDRGLIACVERIEVGDISLDSKHRSEFESLARKLTSLSTSLNRHIKTSKSTHVSEFLERMAAQAEQDEKDIIEGYRRVAEILEELQTEASLKMWTIAEQQLADSRLEALSPAHAAAYNSSLSEEVNRRSCTEGTRANILLELNEWSLDSSKPNIFWMNGMAGTGKTTIAYTFAQSLRARGTLGASFFARVRRMSVGTSGESSLQLRISLRSARLRSDRRAQCVGERSQYQVAIDRQNDERLVVVIDALDECSSADGVGIILDVLFRAAPNLPVKFFVTSRPEPDIRLRVEAHSDQRRSMCVLHDIEQSLVKADIKLYLRDELPKSAVSDPSDPTCEPLWQPVHICSHSRSLISKSGYQNADIDRLYTTILDAAIDDPEQEPEEQGHMRLMLWTAICTREPVNIDTLAALTGITATKADILLQPLYSVLHVSQGTNVVSTLHASFPDYMFDEARSARFYCDEAKHSQLVSEHCFDIMKQQLRFNICSLETSFIADNQVEDLEARIARSISPTLSYAAHHWGDHVSRSVPCEVVREKLEDFLSHRLLFWMEVLSLKRTMNTGINMLSIVKPWLVAKGGTPDSIKFLDDAWIFVSTVAAGSVSQSTPHIYISALAFCHPSSSVYKQYRSSAGAAITDGLCNRTPVGTSCNMENGVATYIPSIRFSFFSDGSMLASGSDDGTILVRDVQTGNPIYDVIKGHGEEVMSVCFSPDGKYILSGSYDRTTRLWDSGNGSLIPNSIKRHSHRVLCTAFSPDGKHIACGLYSDECPIAVYDASTSESLPFPFDAHQSWLSHAFSPNGKTLSLAIHPVNCASGVSTTAPPHTPHPKYTTTESHPLERLLQPLPTWHTRLLGLLRGVLTRRHTSRIMLNGWHRQDVESTPLDILSHAKMQGANHGCPVAISPDGSRIAAAGQDNAIYMFNARDGTATVEPLVAHTDGIRSLAFSPDGRYLASCGDDYTICLWDGTSGKLLSSPLRWYQNWVHSISFSPDGKRVVCASDDRTIRMWDVGDGTLTATDLAGTHENRVWCATFSPTAITFFWLRRREDPYVGLAFAVTRVRSIGSQGHKGSINSVTFSPDGQLIASGSDDGAICVFDSRSGDLVLGPLKGHEAPVRSVVFSPDGSHIVSGSEDRSVRIYRLRLTDSTSRVWKSPGGGAVSDLSHSAPSASDERQTHRAIAGGLTVSQDGWARSRDSQLLFWAPSDIRRVFPTLETVYTIGPEGILQTDYSQSLFLGDEWHRCYVS
ncbi:Polysaccharide lyase family 8, N terminal alpha-helical domain [Rhizoctonia solani]|uniref:Polysaccharide lyase family 8, N terminal alpha-helical domain n=1 Tax=Rhizoctonia solani TaxID=456999 RepID=A0A8H7LWU6_9AGAM|nr:Polysaccharide lyase family 8, N terminal alpha-helical domain [Rhizoctonia solani]